MNYVLSAGPEIQQPLPEWSIDVAKNGPLWRLMSTFFVVHSQWCVSEKKSCNMNVCVCVSDNIYSFHLYNLYCVGGDVKRCSINVQDHHSVYITR